jgi:ABC-type glycerol-3-phosphate transport system substrate-binding protein
MLTNATDSTVDVGCTTRRRFLTATGAATFGVTATAGCTSAIPDGSSGSTSRSDIEEISVIMENVYDTTVIKDLLPEFEENADFSINIQAFPYGTMNEKITTQLRSSESSYEIIIIDNPWVGNFVRGELLQPLNERISGSDAISRDIYMDSMWNSVGAVDGTAYMLPFYNYGLSMLYRKDIAEQENVSIPDRGMSMQKYLEVAESVTGDTNNDDETDFYGAAMQAEKGYKISEEWTNYLYAEDGDVLEGGNVVLDEGDSAVTALENYKRNLENSAPSAARSWGFNEARQLMQNGNAFSILTYNWMLGRLSDTDVGENLAIAEVPGSKAVLGAWGWGIPHNVSDARVDAAWEFLSWVESPETRMKRCMNGGSPTCTDTLNDDELVNKYSNYYPILRELLKDADPLPSVVGGNEMIQTLGTNLSQAVAGSKSSQKAINDAASGLREIKQS